MKRTIVALIAATISLLISAIFVSEYWRISYWHGLYCSLGMASTLGCDVSSSSTASKFVISGIILIVIPIMALVFGLWQNFHLNKHINRNIDYKLQTHHDSIKKMINERSKTFES